MTAKDLHSTASFGNTIITVEPTCRRPFSFSPRLVSAFLRHSMPSGSGKSNGRRPPPVPRGDSGSRRPPSRGTSSSEVRASP